MMKKATGKTGRSGKERGAGLWAISLIISFQVLGLVLFSMATPGSVEAKTFIVTSTLDETDTNLGDGVCLSESGDCTLRAAIQEANAFAGADTIVLKAKKYYLTIPGLWDDECASGDLDITDDLKIKGVSSAKTIVNGGALDRVFQIFGPITVKFVNLSIQNGFLPDNGAGICNVGGTVSLVYCSVVNNVTSGSAWLMGGGIYSEGVESSLTIKSTSVINNMVISNGSQADGGGIAVNNGGTLNISASKIAYNSAIATSMAAAGGIVSLNSADVTITNSKVLANSAMSTSSSSAGGGIAIVGGSTAAVISETNISNNSNTSSVDIAFGGGFYFEDQTATISSCKIKGNRANGGLGLGGGIMAGFSNITIKKASTIVSNLASFDGGGIYNEGSTVTVSPNSVVVNNMPNDQN